MVGQLLATCSSTDRLPMQKWSPLNPTLLFRREAQSNDQDCLMEMVRVCIDADVQILVRELEHVHAEVFDNLDILSDNANTAK